MRCALNRLARRFDSFSDMWHWQQLPLGKRTQRLLDPVPQRARRVAPDAIVDPLTHLLAIDEACFSQESEVVGNRGLLHRHRRLEVADADPPCVARKDVEQLQSHRVREVLEVCRDRRRFGIRATRPRADVAAALPQLAFDYLKCSAHEHMLIEYIDVCQYTYHDRF